MIYFIPDSCQDGFIARTDNNLQLHHNQYTEILDLCEGNANVQIFKAEFNYMGGNDGIILH